MSSPCANFIQQSREYEKRWRKRYFAESNGLDDWYELIHQYIEDELLERIRRTPSEVFIEYWPTWFIIGREHHLKQGMITRDIYLHEFGAYGTGFISVTNHNIYIGTFRELAKKYPVNSRGFLTTFLRALTHEMDSKNPVEEDRVWKIGRDEILGIKVSVDKNSRNYLKLTTITGDWDVYPHFYNNLDAINDAITCLINGAFLEITPARYTVRDPFTLTQSQLQINRGQVGNSIQYDQEKASQGLTYSEARILFEAILEKGVYSVLDDLRAAMGYYPDKSWIPAIVRAISAIAHLLNRCETQAELSTTFCNHYYDIPELRHLCKFSKVDSAFIVPLRKLPDKIDDRVLLTLNIEDINLNEGDHPISCQFSKDGNYLYVFTKQEKVLVYDRYSGYLINSDQIRKYAPCYDHFNFIPSKHKQFCVDDVLYAITVQGEEYYHCDRILKILSIPEFQLRHSFTIPKYALALSSFGDGGILAYEYGSGEIVVVDMNDNFKLLSTYTIQLAKEGLISGISFGPENKWIAIGIRDFDTRTGIIKILDYDNGEIIKSFGEFDGNNWNFAVSPSGKYIATPHIEDDLVSIWNILTDEQISVPKLSSYGNRSVKFSSDDQNVIILNDGNLFVFSLKSREIVEEFKGFEIDYFEVDRFHNKLAAISKDDEIRILTFGNTRRLDTQDDEVICPWQILPIPHRNEILIPLHYGLSLLDIQTLNQSHSDLAVKIHTKYESRHFSNVSRFSVSTSGKHLLIQNDVWTTEKAKVIFTIPSPLRPYNDYERQTSLLNDKYLIDTGNNEKPLLVYDFTTGVIARELVWPSLTERGSFQTFGFNSDNSLIIGFYYGSLLGKSDIIAWNFHNGEVVWKYSEVNAPLWTKPEPTNWDPDRLVIDYTMGIYYSGITTMDISSNQQKIAVGFRSGYLAILNPTDGKVIQYWHAHPSYRSKSSGVTKFSCDFNHDGKLLVSTRDVSKEIKVWNAETGDKLAAFYPDDMITSVYFLERQKMVAVGRKGLYWLEVTGN